MPSTTSPQRRLDHGRSWFVLFGAFLTSASTIGNSATLSTIYKFTVDHVKIASGEQASNMSATFLFALVIALNYISGVVATIIIPSVGYKLTIAIGASLAMLGFGCAAAATRLWHLYLTLGVLTGLGFGISYTPANGVLSYYFSEKRFSFAGSAAATGIAIGVMAYSYIHPGLMLNLPWQSAMLCEAALCVLLFSSALAVRESDITLSRAPVENAEQQIQVISYSKLPKIDISHIYNKLKTGISKHKASKIFPAELYKNCTFYMLVIDFMGILVLDFFFLLTPNFVMTTHGWRNPLSTALVFATYGAVLLVSSIALSILNYFSCARRIPITLQIGLGLLMMIGTSVAYLVAPTSVDSSHLEKLLTTTAATVRKNGTFSVATNSSQITIPLSSVPWTQEPNAVLFVVFSAILGFGATLFASYQARLLFEVVPKECLTAAFACQYLVLGIFQLVLCPVPIMLANASGTLRVGYVVCLGFGIVSMVALLVAVVMIKRNKDKQGLAQVA